RLLGRREEKGEDCANETDHRNDDPIVPLPARPSYIDREARRPRQPSQGTATSAQVTRLHGRNNRRRLRPLDPAGTHRVPDRAPAQPRRRPRPSHARRASKRAAARLGLSRASATRLVVVELDDARARLLAQTLNRTRGSETRALIAAADSEQTPAYWNCC